MQTTPVYLTAEELRKLLPAQNTVAIALCVYLRSGNPLYSAQNDLRISGDAFRSAKAILEDIGLLQAAPDAPLPSPTYNEKDILNAYSRNNDFKETTDAVQQIIGRMMNTEELKILLNITNYLGFSTPMVCTLVNHCISESQKRGYRTRPSMRSIEKEAYRWADMGIETMDQAQNYLAEIGQKDAQIERLKQIVQIRGRNLTPPEQRLAEKWLQMGVSFDLIQYAFERTCLKTGGMNWPYMDKVLCAWKTAGHRTPEDVKNQGRNKDAVPKGSREFEPGEAELASIRRTLQDPLYISIPEERI